MSVTDLAKDERVFGVYGPPLRPKRWTAVAAQVSKVTPLFSAPTPQRQRRVVSIFEPDGPPDTAHPEFGGRLTSHFTSTTPDDHSTHVSGTMIAAGINPSAKGMAPAATLQAFDAGVDFDVLLSTKQTGPASFGSVADNNSWDFGLSWQQASFSEFDWWGNEDAYGAYSGLESEPYDALMRSQCSASSFMPPATTPPRAIPLWLSRAPHRHLDDTPKEFTPSSATSQNGTGTDCPAAEPNNRARSGPPIARRPSNHAHGEHDHRADGEHKNSLTVGAVQSYGTAIASFSSRGPRSTTHRRRSSPSESISSRPSRINHHHDSGRRCRLRS
jgi:hypothetical protein